MRCPSMAEFRGQWKQSVCADPSRNIIDPRASFRSMPSVANSSYTATSDDWLGTPHSKVEESTDYVSNGQSNERVANLNMEVKFPFNK